MERSHFLKNFTAFLGSVFLAVILARSGFFERLLTASLEWEIVGSLVGGFFFTSLLTVAPATVVLGEMAQANSIILVALIGGVGAVIGDLVLFKFLKSSLGDDLVALSKKARRRRFFSAFGSPLFKWLSWVIGAIIIASPLPDELGLFLMGISELKPKILIPVSFVLNSAGILIIGLVARGIGS